MEFAEVIRIRERMCKNVGACVECPLSSRNNTTGKECTLFVKTYPEEAEELIIRWAEVNPAKTNGKHFLEEFPEAYISTRKDNSDGIEMVYVKPNLPSINHCISFPAKWWDEEYKEAPKNAASN